MNKLVPSATTQWSQALPVSSIEVHTVYDKTIIFRDAEDISMANVNTGKLKHSNCW